MLNESNEPINSTQTTTHWDWSVILTLVLVAVSVITLIVVIVLDCRKKAKNKYSIDPKYETYKKLTGKSGEEIQKEIEQERKSKAEKEKQNKTEESTKNEHSQEPHGKKIAKNLLIVSLVVLSICIGIKFIFDATSGNHSQTGLTNRVATNNDIFIETNEDYSFSINYKLIPKENINGLEITFKYLDKNQKPLTTKIKQVGNVNKGEQYTITISLGEFSFSEMYNIRYYSTSVTGGTIPLF